MEGIFIRCTCSKRRSLLNRAENGTYSSKLRSSVLMMCGARWTRADVLSLKLETGISGNDRTRSRRHVMTSAGAAVRGRDLTGVLTVALCCTVSIIEGFDLQSAGVA